MGTGTRKPRIVLGVTTDQSIMLMRGLPELLVEKGWDVHLVSGPGPTLESFTGKQGISTHALEMTRNPSPLKDLRSLVHWIRTLRRLRADIVSVGTPKAGLLGTLAALTVRGSRRVYLLRGLRLETAEGFSRSIFKALERLTMAASTQVLAVSPSLKAAVIRMGLATDAKIVVLGPGSSNGVELERFAPSSFSSATLRELGEELGIAPAVPVIGFVGRLARDKGIDILSDCRPLLIEAGIDHQILLIGGADGSLVEHWSERLNLSGRPVLRTGHIDDTAPYYQLMDVLALPTYREGFPNVALEAQASGIPVVTTDATGAVDSVQSGLSGLVVSAGDSQAFAHALMQVLTNHSLFNRQGIISAVKPFERTEIQSKYIDFYASLLKESPR